MPQQRAHQEQPGDLHALGVGAIQQMLANRHYIARTSSWIGTLGYCLWVRDPHCRLSDLR